MSGDSNFPAIVIGMFSALLVAYVLWSKNKVGKLLMAGWITEIVGAALALAGAVVTFFFRRVDIGAPLLMFGILVGLVGLFLFTRRSDQ